MKCGDTMLRISSNALRRRTNMNSSSVGRGLDVDDAGGGRGGGVGRGLGVDDAGGGRGVG